MSTSRRYGLFAFAVVLWLGWPCWAKDPRTPADILKRIDSLVGTELKGACSSKGVSWPPEMVLFRAFKKERELEVWARNKDQDQMKLILTLPLCALDDEPGPKLRQGDHKTPEGFYYPRFLYWSRNWFMWIKLEQGKVEDSGEVDDGSVFNMYLPYPNELDRARTRAVKFRTTGGSICAHGNCVSDGCLSMKNEDFLVHYAFARHHNPRLGKLQYHVFPFRFDRVEDWVKEAEGYVHLAQLGKERLLRFWENLREGHDLFLKKKNPLRIGFGSTVLRPGDNSPDVTRLKKALAQRKLWSGEMGEQFTPEFKKAVQDFQRQKGLGPDGVVGPGTLRKLGFVWPKRYLFR